MAHKCNIRPRAKDLLEAIENKYESCKKAGIDNTGSFVKQQYIADEMEALKKVI